MKPFNLFLFFILSNVALAQTPTNLDTLSTDNLTVNSIADIDAEFNGGYKKMSKFIMKHLQWEDVMRWPATQKVPFYDNVIVRFIVEKDGSLTYIYVESATVYCPPCNKEAIRLVQEMPKWKPATKNGEPVRNWVRVPINFQVF
ncbi:MAG: hypothetical protein RLZZ211_2107 [Bacteroidota bacterium]|jgi:hypothetical protein